MQHATAILNAISIFEQAETEEGLQATLAYKACGGNEALAKALYYFIPMAYARELLPEVKFPLSYKKIEGNSFVEKSLDENPLYQEVRSVVFAKFQEGLGEEQMLAVLKYSPEFKKVNEALHRGVLWSGIQLQMLRIR
jgi:hypothetical protein